MTDEQEVLFEVRGTLGVITLNRPKALNALTAGMCRQITDQLEIWAGDQGVAAVAVIGSGEKAFCAGGDVVRVARSFQDGTPEGRDFFHSEYLMNIAIDAFPKPYVSLVDGITMGGGVGVSIPGDYWVATEKTLFAMPETGLGLFPDVGGGWFLPRMPGASGMYLALTGARLKAPDLYALGLATHVVDSDQVEGLLTALESATTPQRVAATLTDAHKDPEPAPIAEVMTLIDEYFDGHSVDDILTGLSSDQHPWCQKQLDLLKTKSPTSLMVTFEQMRRGEALESFPEVMQMEYRMVLRCMEGHDFFEGVRAILIDKDQSPKWSPDSLSGVDPATIERHFSPLGPGQDLLD